MPAWLGCAMPACATAAASSRPTRRGGSRPRRDPQGHAARPCPRATHSRSKRRLHQSRMGDLARPRTPSLGVAAPGRVRAVRPFAGQCAISGPRHRCASASRCAIEMPRRQPAEMLAAPLQQLPALRRQQKCWHTVMYWALSKENRRSTLLDQRKNLIKVSGFNAISEAPGGDRRLSG